ncbi:ribonuclease III [Parvularcula sp. LCG005]|uniref:ribonuclease III n=1 Tax=Parvularcula sp. LCG005 TaxID=3078805 RepID=UPI002942B9B6|nr:ribonuclease III [Parvularcula sp. LCG005]WOI54258.1 ribonuclease III [Parvularcula sp. LCG005]
MSKPSAADTREARAVEEALGHEFKDRSLLARALTHASLAGSGVRDLERLEFLGDRVLGLMTAEALWRRYPNMSEGELAPRLNALVRKETCAEAARFWNVGQALHLSTGEERAGGREKDAILGDACEALLGALYIDGGLAAAERAYEPFWGERFDDLSADHRDAKTALQEWAQEFGHGTPIYKDIARDGPDHAPVFTVSVSVHDLEPERAKGTNKRDAQMKAAEAMLRREGVWNKNGRRK